MLSCTSKNRRPLLELKGTSRVKTVLLSTGLNNFFVNWTQPGQVNPLSVWVSGLFNDPDWVHILCGQYQLTSHKYVFLQDVSHWSASGFFSDNDLKTVSIAMENVDFLDFTDTKLEKNWYQVYTNYKWTGTKWKAYCDKLLAFLSLDVDFVQ